MTGAGELMAGYLGLTRETLERSPEAKAGDRILAPCGHHHVLQDSKPPGLLWYRCGEKTKLAGIDGRLVVDVAADAQGNVDLADKAVIS